MIGATTAMNAAYMDPDMAAEIYADPDTITGGVFAPMGKAVREGDHYRVSGRWQWGSGSANCSWLCGGCTIWENGEMKRFPSGAPDARMMVFPASDAVLHDTWHVMGLKGTGSGDIEVKDILVPVARSVSLVSDTPLETGALFKFLSHLASGWNISMFHYRNHGAAYGRVLAGFQVAEQDMSAFVAMLDEIAYPYWPETQNPAYKLFLK